MAGCCIYRSEYYDRIVEWLMDVYQVDFESLIDTNFTAVIQAFTMSQGLVEEMGLIVLKSFIEEILEDNNEGICTDYPQVEDDILLVEDDSRKVYVKRKDYHMDSSSYNKGFADELIQHMDPASVKAGILALDTYSAMTGIPVSQINTSQIGFSPLDPCPFDRPIARPGEIGVTLDIKRSLYDVQKLFDPKTIVTFWAERGAGIVKYSKSDRVKKVFVIETEDYPIASQLDKYKRRMKRGVALIIVSFSCLLADLTSLMVAEKLEKKGFEYDQSLYVSYYVPLASRLADVAQYSATMYLTSKKLSYTELILPDRQSDITTEMACLNQWYTQNITQVVDSKGVFVGYDPGKKEAVSFYQHNAYRDHVVTPESVEAMIPGAVSSFSIGEWLSGTRSSGLASSWYLSVTDVEGFSLNPGELKEGLSISYNPSREGHYIPVSDFETLYVPDRHFEGQLFPTRDKNYYYSEGLDGTRIYIDYDSTESFCKRRIRMIRAGLPVVSLLLEPEDQYSYVVFQGQRNKFSTFVVDLFKESHDMETLDPPPVIQGFGFNKELTKMTHDSTNMVALSRLDVTQYPMMIKKLSRNAGGQHKLSRREKFFTLEDVTTLMVTGTDSQILVPFFEFALKVPNSFIHKRKMIHEFRPFFQTNRFFIDPVFWDQFDKAFKIFGDAISYCYYRCVNGNIVFVIDVEFILMTHTHTFRISDGVFSLLEEVN